MIRHRFIVCLLLTALLAGGCLLSSTEPDDDSGEPPIPYPERTTPENVVAKLMLAYERMELEAYIDCLSTDFTFFLNPDDIAEDPTLPTFWSRATEEAIHERMFGNSSSVDTLQLELTLYGDPVEVPAPDPGEPSLWQYNEEVELTLYTTDEPELVYGAYCGACFILQTDPADTTSSGEQLWRVTEWYDVGKWTRRPCRNDTPVMPVSWGKLKTMF